MKIGIITMHNVRNCGSYLQTYALQKAISSLGYDVEIIDYLYEPNDKPLGLKQKLKMFVYDCMTGFYRKRKARRFQYFRDTFFCLSKESYNRDTIQTNPPKYDVYMTGSDQVWNPRFVSKDSAFMLSFAPKDAYRISYAASFANSTIAAEYQAQYTKYLSKYKDITVREESGVSLVKKLTEKEAKAVCDPVLLWDAATWDEILSLKPQKKTGYILVYVLGYMYDPRPDIYALIDKVQKELGQKVIFMQALKEDYMRPNTTVNNDFGPQEFVSLIKNATFVITDSFHATAFSLIYSKPVMGVVQNVNSSDGRIANILNRVGATNSIVQYNTIPAIHKDHIEPYKGSQEQLAQYRDASFAILKDMLSKADTTK